VVGRKGTVWSFEELEVWKLAREFRQEIYKVTDAFPKDEKFILVEQMRRAAVSVTANIAEGFGRFHYKENIQFCRQARGSLFELIDHLITAHDLSYLNDETFRNLKQSGYRCIKVLNAYVSAINRRSHTPSP